MSNLQNTLPFVSICTPTFNRRPFIPYTIKCIEKQDYPKDKIEWIIIDDGSDKIEDLVKDLSYVKYYRGHMRNCNTSSFHRRLLLLEAVPAGDGLRFSAEKSAAISWSIASRRLAPLSIV